jgi:hypothetical protein
MNIIAIVDDDDQLAETSKWDVEGAGYNAIVIRNGFFENIDALIKRIIDEADGAICDHRLSPRGFASFLGADLVARLYDLNVPALLITQFFQDTDVSIRTHRRKIPVLLRRDMANYEAIKVGLEYCVAELDGNFSVEREPVRTLLQIAGTTEEAGEEVCDVFIPGWNPQVSVRFPKLIISEDLRPSAVEGNFLFAKVNVGAKREEDIYFFDFEPAPTPSEDF